MAFLRYAVPAVALGAQMAAAQCSAVTTTIQNAGDAMALATCSTFSGSIAIATGTTDNIALDGIQEIQGSLIAQDVTMMGSLGASTLTTITDSFTLDGIIVLTSLNFPMLKEVDTFEWSGLPNLQQLAFGTPGVEKTNVVSIQNTQLQSLEGIDPTTARDIMITNNNYLQKITMQLGNVTDSITISANGNQLVTSFPNLIWAANMTLWNQSAIDLPSLSAVNGSLGFYSASFENLTLANLTTVGGSLSVVSSDSVTNISMPVLESVTGGFQIANNSKLVDIDGFPALQSVGGAVDFNGAFTNVSLPALDDVRGAFNLQSSDDITDACNYFMKLSGPNADIKGTFTCKGKTDPKGVGSLPAGTNQGGSGDGNSSTTKTGAANAILIPGAMGFMSFVAVLFGML